MRLTREAIAQTTGWQWASFALAALLVSACAGAGAGDGTHPDHRIYATVSGDDEVVLIDEQSLEVLSHIPVGEGPAILLSTPDHGTLYTANWANDSVSVIDTATEEVTHIPTGGRPYVIAMSPRGDRVYVGVNPSGIAVIDTHTHTIVRTFETPDLSASLIVSPDGDTLYVATFSFIGPGKLRALSTQTGHEVHPPIDVGMVPAWITIHPDGSRVYTLNFLSDDVTVVDTAAWSVESTVDTGVGSQAIIGKVTPDGSTLFVTNHGTAELMAIDTATNTVGQVIALHGRPVGIEFDAAGTRAYVTDFGPESLETAPDINYLLSGNLTTTGPGAVSIYDIESGMRVGEPVTVGSGPTSLVVLR